MRFTACRVFLFLVSFFHTDLYPTCKLEYSRAVYTSAANQRRRWHLRHRVQELSALNDVTVFTGGHLKKRNAD